MRDSEFFEIAEMIKKDFYECPKGTVCILITIQKSPSEKILKKIYKNPEDFINRGFSYVTSVGNVNSFVYEIHEFD